MRLLAVLFFLAFAVLACRPPCNQPDFARAAKLTSEYQLVAFAKGDRVEQRGFGPDRLTLRQFNAFECAASAPSSIKTFAVELGPDCRLTARAQTHVIDTGDRWVSGAFIQSEATILDGKPCALDLDGSRRVAGTVKSGVLVIRDATVSVDLTMDVDGGIFHLVQTGAWEPPAEGT